MRRSQFRRKKMVKAGHNCPTCGRLFVRGLINPRKLACGHHVCSECLEWILDPETIVPQQCSACFTRVECFFSNPVDISLLELAEALKSKAADNREVVKRLVNQTRDIIYDEIWKISYKMKEFYRLMHEKMLMDDMREESYRSLLMILNGLEKNMTCTELKMQFDIAGTLLEMMNDLQMKRLICMIRECTGPSFPRPSKSPITVSPFKLEYRLVKNMYRRGEVHFAVQEFDDIHRFAKITATENKIRLHKLDLEKPPPNAVVYEFDEVVKQFMARNFFPFIEIVYDDAQGCATRYIPQESEYIYFEILRDNLLAHQVMKLCTGENGPSYAGGRIDVKSSSVKVVDYVNNFVRSGADIITGISEDNQHEAFLQPGLVYGSRDFMGGGSLSIARFRVVPEVRIRNVIGSVIQGMEYVCTLAGFHMVGECGIAVQL